MDDLKILFILYLMLLFSLLSNFIYVKNVEKIILADQVRRVEDSDKEDDKKTLVEKFVERKGFKEAQTTADFIKKLTDVIKKIKGVINNTDDFLFWYF